MRTRLGLCLCLVFPLLVLLPSTSAADAEERVDELQVPIAKLHAERQEIEEKSLRSELELEAVIQQAQEPEQEQAHTLAQPTSPCECADQIRALEQRIEEMKQETAASLESCFEQNKALIITQSELLTCKQHVATLTDIQTSVQGLDKELQRVKHDNTKCTTDIQLLKQQAEECDSQRSACEEKLSTVVGTSMCSVQPALGACAEEFQAWTRVKSEYLYRISLAACESGSQRILSLYNQYAAPTIDHYVAGVKVYYDEYLSSLVESTVMPLVSTVTEKVEVWRTAARVRLQELYTALVDSVTGQVPPTIERSVVEVYIRIVTLVLLALILLAMRHAIFFLIWTALKLVTLPLWMPIYMMYMLFNSVINKPTKGKKSKKGPGNKKKQHKK